MKIDDKETDFEQSLVNKLAYEMLHEQRRSRYWSIFFKILTALYVAIFLIIYFNSLTPQQAPFFLDASDEEGHTALIEINGLISADSIANADIIAHGLRNAFADKNTKGIVLRINSPGGSPVQAGYINDEIYRLRKLHPDIPIYSAITDLCASGGYYIAAAADQIYADKASLVGSIGVIMAGFGFVDAIEKLGIERRLLFAGDNKALLDPFSPLTTQDKEHINKLLINIHQQFIDIVKKGRGERLIDNDQLFSGLVWTGEQAVKIGLVDGLGSAGYIARELIQAEHIVDFTPQEKLLDQFIKKFSVSISEHLFPKLTLQ